MRVLFVVQDGEARLLVKDLACRRVDHTHTAIAYGAKNGVVDPAALDELCEQDAFVDDVDASLARAEDLAVVFDFCRVGDDAVDALTLKVALEEQELAVRRHVGPVDDRDARQLASP